LAIVKEEVIRIIELLREEKILAQTRDLTAFIKKGESSNRTQNVVESYRKKEEFLLSLMKEEESTYHLKEINEQFIEFGINDCTPNKLKTIINFWAIKNWIKRHNLEYSRHHIQIGLTISKNEFEDKLRKRHFLAKLIAEYLYRKSNEFKPDENGAEDVLVEFSVQDLKEMAEKEQGMFVMKVSIDDIEDTLFYLSRIEAIKIDGGFLVVHNKLSIDRLEKNSRIQYKESDYEKLRMFYQQKVQQIHIVGEYAKKMIRNYKEALQFVDDYFGLNYSSFLSKYFPGSRQDEIKRTLTPEKFKKLFGALSPEQLEIIKDAQHQYIVVAAGPGSGKTRVLVHKLASLLLAEDVKHEQLLMLTFSRAAATEFKKRLLELIGNAANFIEIKTFHSYCFDLLGRVGSLAQSDDILKLTVEKIKGGDIETSRITKTVLVVDEAQDMNSDEYKLVQTLMEQNEEMRVILVGDDDQNIYGFRGADSRYMQQLITENAAIKYELIENYRSKNNIVAFANQWAASITNRLKDEPGFAKQSQNGNIQIVAYSSNNLIVPLVDAITKTDLSGTCCILTKTNEEATQITGLLVQKGLRAKLIQSNDGFNLSNLFELRFFSDQLKGTDNSPVISEQEWASALRKFSAFAEKSSIKELVLSITKQFELTNPVKKYKSDWKAFIAEAKIEDFINIETETVFVSTIHKAKGKEFDNVFIMLKDFKPDADENKRQLYVAITRTKTNLTIHYNGKFLRELKAEELTYTSDDGIYAEPQQISIQLSLRDVFLSYFENVQYKMNLLYSGCTLKILPEGLGNFKGELFLRYSNNFKATLSEWKQKGFTTAGATVNFIVYWKKPEEGKEIMIVLPEIMLKK
ncbi:MAG: ATP-dependent helicase, partial [Chitinophagaceae bacterium]|nr:ATP-dependent helicase [Chitinophagaceae bacterium]